MRLPEPSKRPLSRQGEAAVAATVGAGVVLLTPVLLGADGEFARQLMIASSACMIASAAPLAYQIVQGLRWFRRTAL